jgi:hypothetical protein
LSEKANPSFDWRVDRTVGFIPQANVVQFSPSDGVRRFLEPAKD